jgi:hypothetical protein
MTDLLIEEHRIGIAMTGGTDGNTDHCIIDCPSLDASAIAVLINSSGSGLWIVHNHLDAISGIALELRNASTVNHIYGNTLGGGVAAFKMNSAYTGNTVRVDDNVLLGPVLLGLATDPLGLKFGTNYGMDGYQINATSGGTITPDRSRGRTIRIVGATTGSAYTTAAPTPTPENAGIEFLVLEFVCAAGAPITGWGVNAIYHLSSGPSTTDNQVTTYLLVWFKTEGIWREVSRSVTAI